MIAVRRERQFLAPCTEPSSDEISYYATRVADREMTDDELLDAIRGHGSAHGTTAEGFGAGVFDAPARRNQPDG